MSNRDNMRARKSILKGNRKREHLLPCFAKGELLKTNPNMDAEPETIYLGLHSDKISAKTERVVFIIALMCGIGAIILLMILKGGWG